MAMATRIVNNVTFYQYQFNLSDGFVDFIWATSRDEAMLIACGKKPRYRF